MRQGTDVTPKTEKMAPCDEIDVLYSGIAEIYIDVHEETVFSELVTSPRAKFGINSGADD